MTPRVSVLIPTLGAEPWLAELVPALASQRVEGGHELVVVDSDSSDCTRQLLRRAGARVEWIPRSAFGHGRTRNHLARLARGELLVFLSQDAAPEGEGFLAELCAALDDERVAAATARILPRAGDDPLTRRTALAAPEAQAAVRIWDASDLAGGGGPAVVRFNNVASAVRARAWREHPFPDLAFGEDVAWAEVVLRAGWRIAFAPRAVARHAHAYRPSAAFRRYRTDAAFLLAQRGLRVRPGLLSAARGWAHEVREDWRFLAREGGAWPHALRSPVLRAAQVLGQWAGSRGVVPVGLGTSARDTLRPPALP